MTTIYAPKTIIRAYNADKTAHHTAVVTKVGEIYEIKSFDNLKPKENFKSYDEWVAVRAEGLTIEIDTSKADHAPIAPPAKHGFNYPAKRTDNPFAAWLYETVAEGCPHLLGNPDVRDAYNAFVDFCKTVASQFVPNYDYIRPWSRYRQNTFPAPEYACGSYTTPIGCYRFMPDDRYRQIKVDFVKYYEPLYNLVSTDVFTFMRAKTDEIYKKARARQLNRLIGVEKRRVERYQKLANAHAAMRDKYQAELDKL